MTINRTRFGMRELPNYRELDDSELEVAQQYTSLIRNELSNILFDEMGQLCDPNYIVNELRNSEDKWNNIFQEIDQEISIRLPMPEISPQEAFEALNMRLNIPIYKKIEHDFGCGLIVKAYLLAPGISVPALVIQQGRVDSRIVSLVTDWYSFSSAECGEDQDRLILLTTTMD